MRSNSRSSAIVCYCLLCVCVCVCVFSVLNSARGDVHTDGFVRVRLARVLTVELTVPWPLALRSAPQQLPARTHARRIVYFYNH